MRSHPQSRWLLTTNLTFIGKCRDHLPRSHTAFGISKASSSKVWIIKFCCSFGKKKQSGTPVVQQQRNPNADYKMTNFENRIKNIEKYGDAQTRNRARYLRTKMQCDGVDDGCIHILKAAIRTVCRMKTRRNLPFRVDEG